MCGDATSAEDVEASWMARKQTCLTDPSLRRFLPKPRRSDHFRTTSKGEGGSTTSCFSAFQKHDRPPEKRRCLPTASMQREGSSGKAFIDAGFHLAGGIWVTEFQPVLGRSDYQWQHEPIYGFFYQNGKHPCIPTANRQPSGITTNQSAIRIIRPASRWIFWAIHSELFAENS